MLCILQPSDGAFLSNNSYGRKWNQTSVSTSTAVLDISQVTIFFCTHTYHLNEPRYVFDGKPPDMKSGEVICTCNTFISSLVLHVFFFTDIKLHL